MSDSVNGTASGRKEKELRSSGTASKDLYRRVSRQRSGSLSIPAALATIRCKFSPDSGTKSSVAPTPRSICAAPQLQHSTKLIQAVGNATKILSKDDQATLEYKTVLACISQLEQVNVETYPLYVAISALWWRQWTLWSGLNQTGARDSRISRPGPLRNAPLLERSPNMNDLVQGIDYEWIPEEVWRALSVWYTYDVPPLYRSLNCRAAQVSSTERGMLVAVKRRSCSIYEDYVMPEVPSHWDASWRGLWECDPRSDALTGAPLTDAQVSERPPCAACLKPGPRFACKSCAQARYCDQGCQAAHWIYHRDVCHLFRDQPSVPVSVPDLYGRRGKVGLSNLGNTCYMNSTIQCLSHCWPLTRYFLSRAYQQDRNKVSKLGTEGRFADLWFNLMRELWMGTEKVVHPVAMKRAIGSLPGSGGMFAGLMQHDAQELLIFLLDTLHEDLNLVEQKPYFAESPVDFDVNNQQSIAHLAADSWSKHLQRDHSMVTHLLEGQQHNIVVCPQCKYRSNTFQSFKFLTLALPVNVDRTLVVTVVRLVHDERSDSQDRLRLSQVRYSVSVSPGARCRALKARLGELSGVAPGDQWLVQVRGGLLRDEFLDPDPVAKISSHSSSALFMYELTSPDVLFPLSPAQTRACSDQDETDDERGICEIVLLHRFEHKAVAGTPLILRFRSSTTFRQIRIAILRLLTLLTTGTDSVAGNVNSPEVSREAAELALSCTDYEGVSLDIQNPSYESKQSQNWHQSSDPSAFPASDLACAQSPFFSTKKTTCVAVDWLMLGDGPNIHASAAAAFYAAPGNSVTKRTASFDCSVDGMGSPSPMRSRAYSESEDFAPQDDQTTIRYLEKLRKRKALAQKHQGETYSLHECLNFFSNVEQLGSEDMWSCAQCETLQQAYKMMNIIRLPEILIFTLKRFESGFFRSNKITALVDFPFEGLDMAPYLAAFGGTKEKEDTLFDLFAVTNHHGTTGFGHYTSFVARQDGPGPPKWFEFDDSRVTGVSKSSVLSSAAYVLYYKRRRPTSTASAP